MIEFKLISEFSRGTLYNQLLDAYSFNLEFKKNYNNMWKEYDDFFYDNLSIADKCGFVTVVDGIPIGHITWDPRNPQYIRIGHNCIITKYKGNGYGKLQFENAIKIISHYKVRKIVVTTNEILKSAQKNYESVGFKKVAVRDNTSFIGKYIDYELYL